MLLSEVVSQERRHSSAIKMARRDSALSISSEASTCSKKKNEKRSSRSPSIIPRTLQRRRRSSFFKGPYYPDPNFTWKASEAGNWAIVQADGSEISLVFRKSQTSSMKNFGLEVRGIRDVYNLLEDAGIVLSPKSTRLKDLVKEMVTQINKSLDGSSAGVNYEDVKEELFTDTRTETFATTLQGYLKKEHREPIFDPSWLCAFCNLSTIKRRYVAIARMKQPTNFGDSCQEVRFFILVLCPSKSKETKTALETSRTFATLFSDPNLRNLLLDENTVAHFKGTLSDWASRVSIIPPINGETQQDSKDPEDGGASVSIDGVEVTSTTSKAGKENSGDCCNRGGFGSGIVEDLKRRLPHYASDFTDGIADGRAISKTISTSVFLFFACLLPTIAFATLNSKTTKGRMDVRKGIFSQTVGQLIFAVIGGQHLSILLTTAPLSLFVKIIFSLSEMFEIVDQFEAFYCCVGLWTSFFLLLSALFNLSRVMKFCTRSTEEIFALFISIAFIVYAAKDTVHEFQENYNSEACETTANLTFITSPNHQNDTIRLPQPVYRTLEKELECHRDSSLLHLLLMFGTFWFGFTLYNFKNTPFLPRSKREILSDYSLPLAVILFSFIGSFLFENVPAHRFNYDDSKPLFQLAPFYKLDWHIIGVSAGLGKCLSVLIFMDQNIGSAIVNNPSNKLTKGESYNWDLVVISIINGVSSLFALPWLHVALPHAPMHVKCLADIEERVEHGHIKQTVVRVRETRLTTILSHILMGLSLLLLPYPLSYILPSVFDGLYLYMGITALAGNHLFERILLIFTEQLSYPPTHYIRQVPQRKIHLFTLIQVVQLLILCVLGFFPYPFVEVLFPLMLLFLLFTRQKILPHVIEKKFLDVLDG